MGRDDCPFGSECFAVLAKDKALASDVVVTNHTLLAIEIVDSHPILPERDVVIEERRMRTDTDPAAE